MTDGVSAHALSDDLLRHELLQLKDHESEIGTKGTADQKKTQASRTAELEAEFSKRFAHIEPQSEDTGPTQSDPQPGSFPGAGEGPHSP
jgi:hypothetical protein